jgi:hypothetical protein
MFNKLDTKRKVAFTERSAQLESSSRFALTRRFGKYGRPRANHFTAQGCSDAWLAVAFPIVEMAQNLPVKKIVSIKPRFPEFRERARVAT